MRRIDGSTRVTNPRFVNRGFQLAETSSQASTGAIKVGGPDAADFLLRSARFWAIPIAAEPQTETTMASKKTTTRKTTTKKKASKKKPTLKQKLVAMEKALEKGAKDLGRRVKKEMPVVKSKVTKAGRKVAATAVAVEEELKDDVAGVKRRLAAGKKSVAKKKPAKKTTVKKKSGTKKKATAKKKPAARRKPAAKKTVGRRPASKKKATPKKRAASRKK